MSNWKKNQYILCYGQRRTISKGLKLKEKAWLLSQLSKEVRSLVGWGETWSWTAGQCSATHCAGGETGNQQLVRCVCTRPLGSNMVKSLLEWGGSGFCVESAVERLSPEWSLQGQRGTAFWVSVWDIHWMSSHIPLTPSHAWTGRRVSSSCNVPLGPSSEKG